MTPEIESLAQQLIEAATPATPGNYRVSMSGLSVKSDTELYPNIVCQVPGGPNAKELTVKQWVFDADWIALASPENITAVILAFREELKTVLDRESASQKRHDDKMEQVEGELKQARRDALVEAAKEVDELGWDKAANGIRFLIGEQP